MFLFRFLFWLLLLPFRLVFFVIGWALWVLTLPVRMLFGILGLIGLWRIVQLGIISGTGYFFYRLVNGETDAPLSTGSQPARAQQLNTVPTT